MKRIQGQDGHRAKTEDDLKDLHQQRYRLQGRESHGMRLRRFDQIKRASLSLSRRQWPSQKLPVVRNSSSWTTGA